MNAYDWNYRVVRRYVNDRATYLELCAVDYVSGVPVGIITAPPVRAPTEEAALSDLRWRHKLQQFGLNRPILDERKDFSGQSDWLGVLDQGEAGRAAEGRQGQPEYVVRFSKDRAAQARRVRS